MKVTLGRSRRKTKNTPEENEKEKYTKASVLLLYLATVPRVTTVLHGDRAVLRSQCSVGLWSLHAHSRTPSTALGPRKLPSRRAGCRDTWAGRGRHLRTAGRFFLGWWRLMRVWAPARTLDVSSASLHLSPLEWSRSVWNSLTSPVFSSLSPFLPPSLCFLHLLRVDAQTMCLSLCLPKITGCRSTLPTSSHH